MAATWIDLLDPTAEELRAHAPRELEETALELLLAPPQHDDEPRPTLQGHGDYVFGVLLLPVAVPEEDRVFYQEVDLVLTHDTLLTVRKTPPGGVRRSTRATVQSAVAATTTRPGMIAYRLVDDIAERYLDLVDDVDAEIDELEDMVEDAAAATTRAAHLRAAARPAPHPPHARADARRCAAGGRRRRRGREGPDVFPHDVEVAFDDAYDKLLRASDGLELARDLLASVRDYHQSKIANDQNEVMKRLTVDRLAPPPADVHRRPLRPELRAHARAALALRLRVLVGPDRRHDRRAAVVVPTQELGLVPRDARLPHPVLDERRARRARRRPQGN